MKNPIKSLLKATMGEVSYIDEFGWPVKPVRGPAVWYNDVDFNSLYPGMVKAFNAPLISISTDSTMEELEGE